MGDYAEKPGWIRASFHPTTSDKEVKYIVDAINQVTENIIEWANEYRFNPASGDFEHKNASVEYPSLTDFQPLKLTDIEEIKTEEDVHIESDFEVHTSPSLLKKIFG